MTCGTFSLSLFTVRWLSCALLSFLLSGLSVISSSCFLYFLLLCSSFLVPSAKCRNQHFSSSFFASFFFWTPLYLKYSWKLYYSSYADGWSSMFFQQMSLWPFIPVNENRGSRNPVVIESAFSGSCQVWRTLSLHWRWLCSWRAMAHLRQRFSCRYKAYISIGSIITIMSVILCRSYTFTCHPISEYCFVLAALAFFWTSSENFFLPFSCTMSRKYLAFLNFILCTCILMIFSKQFLQLPCISNTLLISTLIGILYFAQQLTRLLV